MAVEVYLRKRLLNVFQQPSQLRLLSGSEGAHNVHEENVDLLGGGEGQGSLLL